MALKLDVKDRKILYELDKNSRQPYSSLAKKAGLSQEAVRYRVNRLVENKVISKFFTVVNISMLGLTFYKILLKFHNINERKKEEIINYLIKQDFVVWIADTDGSYDLSFVMEAGNLLKAKEFLSDFYQNYSSQIHARAFSVNLTGEYLTRDYLIDKKRVQEAQPSYSSESQKLELDKTNLKIISLLAENSRISAVEIANKLGISADSVLQRIKKLEKLNVLTRYNIVLNHEALNQVHYKVFIYLNNISKQKENSLYSYCRAIPQIVYIINTFGEWDMEIDLEVGNIREFRKVMMEITSRFSDIIKDYTYLVIYKVRKYNLYPKNL